MNKKATIKEGWANTGKVLDVLGPNVFVREWWTPVLDPDKKDPTFYKTVALDFEEAPPATSDKSDYAAASLIYKDYLMSGTSLDFTLWCDSQQRLNSVKTPNCA